MIILKPDLHNNISAIISGLLSGVLAAFAMIQIKKLGESESVIVFFFSMFISVSGIIKSLFDGWSSVDYFIYLNLILIGLFGLFGQLALTRALSKGSTILNASLQYLTIIFANIMTILFFEDKITISTSLGILMIIFANCLSINCTIKVKNNI